MRMNLSLTMSSKRRSRYNPLINYKWNTVNTNDTRYLKDSGTSKSNADMFFGRGCRFNGVDQDITIDINSQIQTIYSMIDTVATFNETTQTLTTYVINNANTNTTHNNYIFYDGIFTQTHKDYLSLNPETFLYKEDGVLKSQILNQSEIDNVVAYFPMCETDGYVRDLANYSEDSNNINQVNTSFSFASGAGTNVYTASNFEQVIACSADGNTVSRLTGSNSPYPSGYWVVTLDVTEITGSPVLDSIYLGISTPVNKALVLGENKFIAESSGSYPYLYTNTILLSGENVTFNVSCKLVSDIYPIANYTDAVRDGAVNLNKGLQTAKLKRDNLGVPYKLNDYLECDSVGYANTFWKPSVTDSWTIDTIIDIQPTESADCWMGSFNGATLNDQVIIGTRGNGDTLYLGAGSGRSTANVSAKHGRNQVTLSYDATNQKAIGYLGTFKFLDLATTLTNPTNFGLGARLDPSNVAIEPYFNGNISHFNVHDGLISGSALLSSNITSGKFGEITVIAHKGLAEVRPENTLIAFSHAIEQKYKVMECDISMTSDSVPVIIHDSTVDRTTDGTGLVSSFTLSEIKLLDAGSHFNAIYAGERIPTLAETLELCISKGVTVSFDLKNVGGESDIDIIYGIISSYNYSRVRINSADFSRLQYYRSLNATTPLEMVSGDADFDLNTLDSLGGELAVLISTSSVATSNDYIRQAISLGITVQTWEVNTMNEIVDYSNELVRGMLTSKDIMNAV